MREYLALPRWRRLLYRLHHEPVIMGCWCSPWEGWLYDFAVQHRWPYVAQRWWTAERRSVYWTNVALAVVLMILAFTGGMRALLLVHRQCERRFAAAALEGSSYLRLPTPLRWLTANVGCHHVHHLSPRTPSYRLQRCHGEVPALRRTVPVSWRQALRAPWLVLWDEDRERMVGFRDATRRGGARAERRPTRRGGARVEPRLARRGAG